MKKLIGAIVLAILLSGCAGSAQHPVLQVTDVSGLSCSQIKVEKQHAKDVIAGVKKDQDDVTGSDVFDTVMWFPFNMIAKDANYKEAVKAAQARIQALNAAAKSKKCNP